MLLYFKYVQLKSMPLDDWWAQRLEEATPRMRRMIRESQEIYEEEQAAARAEQAPGGVWGDRAAAAIHRRLRDRRGGAAWPGGRLAPKTARTAGAHAVM